MKKFFMNYYGFILFIPFLIYNLFLDNLILDGVLFYIFIIIHILLLILFRKSIKGKSILVIVYFLTLFIVKNKIQLLFGFSSMLLLLITGFMESNVIKILSIFITIFFAFFSIPMVFIFSFFYGLDASEDSNDIYEDTHYYCENNYEIYSYSGGAMDEFHYSLGKYYVFLDIGDIVYVSYRNRNEVSQEEYTNFLHTHHCKLVDDKSKFK